MPVPEELLLDFVTSAAATPLPTAVREKAGLSLLDAVSLAAAARDHEVVRAVATLTTGTTGGARSWTSGARLPVTDACFANATAAHAHFHDDTDMVAWAHPGSLVTPVPVALAQAEALDAGQVLTGIAVGYATLTWFAAEQEVARAIVERGFRAGPTLGTLAAAMAAAATLRLSRDQTRSALGIAADSTGALLEPVRAGAQDWRLQNATSAMRGAQAALLARAGVTGSPLPLTGPRAFLLAFTGSDDIPTRWATPPVLDDIHRTWFKTMPTLGDNMAVAVAAAQLHHDALAGRPDVEIGAVTVGMNAHFAAYPGTAYRGPFETIDQATASTRFAVAALLVHGRLRYRDYPALLDDDDVLALVDRIDISPDPDLDYVSGWVRAEVGGEAVERSAADAPRTLFFRDRDTARAAATEATGPTSTEAVTRWFAWLDGADATAPVDDLINGFTP